MTDLLTPLHYDYMLRAIWVSALVGGVCGFLSPFITLKGWSLMGDALSHAVVPGVAVAYALKLPFAAGAFVAGLLASGAMALIKAKSRIREDASIGIVFTSFFALGLLLISLNPAGVDRKTIILGNLMGIPHRDVVQLVIISVVTLLVIGLKWRDLMLFCFDPGQAHTLGLRTGLLHVTLLTLLSATAVAALQTVGAVLVVALLITPGATAYLLTDRFGRMIWISAGLGITTSLLGAYASYFFNGATGGCIVTLQTLIFLTVFHFAPKHGLLSARRRARTHLEAEGAV
jgi:ABC-type Mn2+/Zn2+ transport system permease subunit